MGLVPTITARIIFIIGGASPAMARHRYPDPSWDSRYPDACLIDGSQDPR
jgi:hypothetical protein